MDLWSAFNKAIPRKKEPKDLKDVVDYLGGTKKAAEKIGMSQRQVQRYLKAEREGKSTNKSPGAARLRDEAHSPLMRRLRLSGKRESKLRGSGATMSARGHIGRTYKGSTQLRDDRELRNVELTPEQMGQIMDAYLAGDRDGAQDALESALDEQYLDGMVVEDLDFLDFE